MRLFRHFLLEGVTIERNIAAGSSGTGLGGHVLFKRFPALGAEDRYDVVFWRVEVCGDLPDAYPLYQFHFDG